MNPDQFESLTGMKKPTHRGRRSRGKGPRPPIAPAAPHDEAHAALNDAMAELPDTGDHDKAKKAALNLVKFLHLQSKKADA